MVFSQLQVFCWLLGLPSWFCRNSQLLQALGVGLHFLFPVVQQGRGFSLGYNDHRYPVSSPCPQSLVPPTLSSLQSCAGQAQINRLTLYPFYQSMRCAEWEKIMPTPLPPFGQAATPARSLPSAPHFPFWKNVSLGAAATPSHCPAFHTLQLSGKCRVYLTQSQSVEAHLFSQFQVLPKSPAPTLWDCLGQWLPLQLVCAASCLWACFPFFPPWWLYAFKSLLACVCDLPALGWEGAPRLLSLAGLSSDGLSSNAVPQAAMVSGTMPEDFPTHLENLLSTHF